ncbi:MAG: hypothetical protein PHT62_07080 [Desulfotomaculaceae bacterium]|nr:hypothetical protein [Desulfotomaculaceae bacterium]
MAIMLASAKENNLDSFYYFAVKSCLDLKREGGFFFGDILEVVNSASGQRL